jgi:uncharacterized damage-inducible protein DinB
MTVQFLRNHLDAELVITRDVLEAARHGPLAWKPHPSSFSLGRLAMHVATIPGWLPAFTRSRTYDMGTGGPGPDVPASSDEILVRHEEAVARAHATLDVLDDAALTEQWVLLRNGAPVASMTRAEAISRYVVRHMVHHRGQLTVYLRLQDLPIPALYGDSADRRLLPPDLPSC